MQQLHAMPTQTSLKKRLLIFVSGFSLLLGGVLIATAYWISLGELDEILDAQMKNLAERVAAHDPAPIKSHFDIHKRYHEEDLFIDVWEKQEHPQHQFDLLLHGVNQAGFYDRSTSQGVWRMYVLPTEKYQIQVSQPFAARSHLALELATSMFVPYLVMIPFILWGLGWVILRSLRPMDEFRQEIARRDLDELTPIKLSRYPVELIPTIQEMNYLFERIESAQQEQRQFIADAAHELRTPITALNLQMQILLREFPENTALENLSQGLIRIQHLISQLLDLAKQDASGLHIMQQQPFYLNQVAVNCVEQLIHVALQKEIDLGMERQEEVVVNGLESAARSIIYNLIDNAIKYTPKNGVINVSIFSLGNDAVIQVEDSGPGIDPALYEQIMKRFYRIHHHLEMGSGLGLSIVQKATEHLGGKIQFGKSQTLGGLFVQVQFPRQMKSVQPSL
jgi:signal transduction histidine kinase